MAVFKMVNPPIHPGSGKRGTYAHLKKAIDYVLNPEKTGGGLYTGSLNCVSQKALSEMIATKVHYGKEPKSRKDRLAYHFVISWKPEEEVSPETALEITKKFCEEYLSDYEVVYSAHLDQAHMHTHIVFNSVSYRTGKKFRYENGDWERIQQPLVDRLCEENGLHTLEMDTGIKLKEYAEDHTKKRRRKSKEPSGDKGMKRHTDLSYEKNKEYSHSDYVREDIDTLITECSSFEAFELGMKQRGYQIWYGNTEKYGTYMAVKNNEMRRARRTYVLGPDYTVDMIKSRIAAYHVPLPDEVLEPEERYLLTGRFYRCRINYRTDNQYLRKQYARMFRLGVIQKNEKRPPYRETVKRLRELRCLEYQLELISDNDYREISDLDADISEQEKSVAGLKEEIKQQKQERRPYEKMLIAYEKLEELEGAFLLYREGDQSFREEAEQYAELQQDTELFPHTKEELEDYLKIQKVKQLRTKRKLREEQKKLETLRSLRKEYEMVMAEYAPADDEMLEAMEEHTRESMNCGKQKRRKEM